jgi:Domain of unknown function DUF29
MAEAATLRPVKAGELGERGVDFHAWLLEQAAALRRHCPDGIDWNEIAEELEAMGARERREIKAHLKKLLAHLLKWHYQPQELQRRAHSWRKSIDEAREEITDIVADSPSLGGQQMTEKLMPTAYQRARNAASQESGLDVSTFPEQCPWEYTQIIESQFLSGRCQR